LPADFTRSSRRASEHELPPEFRAALERHAELVGADLASLDDARAVAVTESMPRSRGFLRRRREYATWILVGEPLLVIVSDASGQPVASTYRRDDLEARPFSSPLVEDEGLDVVAMPVGGSERVSVFVPLEPGPVRDEILAALR
jgi:hypothetical protein